MTISTRIFSRLETLNMTQHEFSKRTGILPSTISEWKNGTNPSSDKIMSICRALQVSPEWLLEGSTPDYGGADEHSSRGSQWNDNYSSRGYGEHIRAASGVGNQTNGSSKDHDRSDDYYTIHKSSNMGRLITMYLKIKPAMQGRVIGYMEGLSEAE